MGLATIMAHLVAGFPTNQKALEVGGALLEGGAGLLEVQIPFSDPSADGPAIQRACQQALDAGFAVADAFSLVKQLRSRTQAPIYVMSYANLAFRPGLEGFLQRCRDNGTSGVIIPDLPPDYDEGLYAYARELGLDALPVVPVSASFERLETVLRLSQATSLYTALRVGVTGKETRMEPRSIDFLRHARNLGVRVLAGFGINSPAQVRELADQVDVLIVGSALVREIQAACERGVPEAPPVRDLMQRLVGALDHPAPNH